MLRCATIRPDIGNVGWECFAASVSCLSCSDYTWYCWPNHYRATRYRNGFNMTPLGVGLGLTRLGELPVTILLNARNRKNAWKRDYARQDFRSVEKEGRTLRFVNRPWSPPAHLGLSGTGRSCSAFARRFALAR